MQVIKLWLKKRQIKHSGPIQLINKEALNLKKHLCINSQHLSIYLGYEQLKISLPCSCLQDILAARELFAGELPKDFLLNDCTNTMRDTVLRKLPRLSEETVVGKRESGKTGFSTAVLMSYLRLKFFTFKDKEKPIWANTLPPLEQRCALSQQTIPSQQDYSK